MTDIKTADGKPDPSIDPISGFSVCRGCNPPHVENCPNCFGYGFSKDNRLIAAGEAGENWKGEYVRCPVCDSTPYNDHLIILYGTGKGEPVGILNGKDVTK